MTRKYVFTPELHRELRLAYCGLKSEISANLDRMVRTTGWPRHAFKMAAQRLGLVTADHRREWGAEEIKYLEEHAGESAGQIARALHRTVPSVQGKLASLWGHGSAEYSLRALGALFGEGEAKVRSWVNRGLFGQQYRYKTEVAVSEGDVRRFITGNACEYNLIRVNQERFKLLLFAGVAASDAEREF